MIYRRTRTLCNYTIIFRKTNLCDSGGGMKNMGGSGKGIPAGGNGPQPGRGGGGMGAN